MNNFKEILYTNESYYYLTEIISQNKEDIKIVICKDTGVKVVKGDNNLFSNLIICNFIF